MDWNNMDAIPGIYYGSKSSGIEVVKLVTRDML